jgi:hypothetical protein
MRIGREDYNQGSDEPREQPEAGETYPAVIGCIEDVGVHKGFKDGDPAKVKVCIGYEIEARDSKGARFVLFQKHNLNLYKSDDGGKVSNLRALFDTLRPGVDNSEVETADFVGMNCRVLVSHDAKGRARVDRVLPAKAGQAVKAEQDYSKPFGLWDYLLKNRIDRE